MSPYIPRTLSILAVVVVIASVASGAPERYETDLLRCGENKCKPKEDPCAAKEACNQKPKDDCGCDDDENDDDDDDGGCGCRRNLRTLPANPPPFVDYGTDWGFMRRERTRRQANLTQLRTKGVATALVKSHQMKKVLDKVPK